MSTRERLLFHREKEGKVHHSAWCPISIHFVIVRSAEIIPANPEELPPAFRAEMGSRRRSAATAGILQKILLAAL